MDEQQIRRQWQRYLNGETTAAEAEELLNALAMPGNQELAEQLLEASFDKQNKEQELSSEKQQQILSHIFTHEPARKRPLWPRIAAAASIVLALSVGGYFILHKPQPQQQVAQNTQNDIEPGSNKAILTLADGKKIVVTGAAKGTLATQANMRINKTADGRINYQANTSNPTATGSETPVMNTLSTQMGGETSLTLADGTEVKLDAASSITYPVAFNGKERRVSVTGQAYFKVKHNAKQPFFVTAGGQTIEDIGTEFNVNSYENVRTTLVVGSISVNNKVLVPGQQATLVNNQLVVAPGDPEEAAAWANGYFRFNNENIHTIMDKISRWYNIEVVYDPGVSGEGLTGTASRYKNISQVFYMLSYTKKVHFKIEGRRVTVLR